MLVLLKLIWFCIISIQEKKTKDRSSAYTLLLFPSLHMPRWLLILLFELQECHAAKYGLEKESISDGMLKPSLAMKMYTIEAFHSDFTVSKKRLPEFIQKSKTLKLVLTDLNTTTRMQGILGRCLSVLTLSPKRQLMHLISNCLFFLQGNTHTYHLSWHENEVVSFSFSYLCDTDCRPHATSTYNGRLLNEQDQERIQEDDEENSNQDWYRRRQRPRP